jgi:RecB family exonuclease
VVTWPRGDLRRNAERTASRWAPSGGDRVPSYVSGVRASAFPPTEQEYALRDLLCGAHVDVLAARSERFRRGTEMVRARQSPEFTRYDGNLSHVAGRRDPSDQVFSATRLEAYASCPHAYLLEYELRVELVENPEDILEISALDRGSIFHRVLERYIRDGAEPGDMRDLFASACEPYLTTGRVGRAVFWEHTQAEMARDLAEFADHDSEHRAAGETSLATELAFGLPGSGLEPIEVALPDGRTVRFRGSIDRVDVRPDDSLIVLDYKTGRQGDYRVIQRDDPVQKGRRLQLPIYAHAARTWVGDSGRPVEAWYWFVTGRGQYERVGYRLDERVEARFGEVLTVLIDGLAAGHYPARPPEVVFTRRGQPSYFDPDGLGGRDREREWERKRGAPGLADYLALVEPDG